MVLQGDRAVRRYLTALAIALMVSAVFDRYVTNIVIPDRCETLDCSEHPFLCWLYGCDNPAGGGGGGAS